MRLPKILVLTHVVGARGRIAGVRVIGGDGQEGVAEAPGRGPGFARHLGSRMWGQKMGSKGSKFAESERGVWF